MIVNFVISMKIVVALTLILIHVQAKPKAIPNASLSTLFRRAVNRKPVDRNLFLEFSWNSNEKRFVQRERMKEIMKNTLQNLMERYQFDTHLDQWNHEVLEDVHRQYYKAKSNVQLAKHFLLEKMDNIYNNFVQPARWFY